MESPGYVIAGARRADGSLCELFVAGGRFVNSAPLHARRIQADGLIVLPGLVDPHTHLREPGNEAAETIATGTQAAARGGFTAVCAMPNTTPATNTPREVAWLHERAHECAATEVVPIGTITKDRAGTELSDLSGLGHAGVRLFSDDGACVMDAKLMRDAFRAVQPFDGVLAQHAQDAHLADGSACCAEGLLSEAFNLPPWPAAAESVIVARDVELAQETGGRLHLCHLSTAESVEIVRWAKARGLNVTAEVTPHHLLLGTALLANHDTTFKVNPPLRPDADIEALRVGLVDGTIDMIGTDHAPHTPADKDHEFPIAKPGMIGLEQALAVLLETMVGPGRLDWSDVVRLMSTAPATLVGLSAQGRPLLVGEPANFVLVDPTRRSIVDRFASASLARNNPYHGLELPDPIELTMWAGRITYQRSA